MRGDAALDIRVPSDVQRIAGIVELVVHRCREHSFNGRQLSLNVPVALTEALSNAMLRGNRADSSRHVRVRAEMVGENLVLEVEDEGEAFDLESCTGDPTTPENLLKEEGRGLFLMRNLMDSVERSGESGNIVRLKLRRR